MPSLYNFLLRSRDAREQQICICGEGVDRLDGEIGVVRDVSGEVIGRELIFRIEAMLPEVLSPLGELWPEALSEIVRGLPCGRSHLRG